MISGVLLLLFMYEMRLKLNTPQENGYNCAFSVNLLSGKLRQVLFHQLQQIL